MKPWKAAEYRAAKALGGKRVPLSGGLGAPCKGDVEIPGWHVEVKYRKISATMTMFLEVEKVAKKEHKKAILVITEKNAHGQLAVIRLKEFEHRPKMAKED